MLGEGFSYVEGLCAYSEMNDFIEFDKDGM